MAPTHWPHDIEPQVLCRLFEKGDRPVVRTALSRLDRSPP